MAPPLHFVPSPESSSLGSSPNFFPYTTSHPFILPLTMLLFFAYSIAIMHSKHLLLNYRNKLLLNDDSGGGGGGGGGSSSYWSPTFHARPKAFQRVPIKFKGRPRSYCTIRPEQVRRPDENENENETETGTAGPPGPQEWNFYLLGWAAFVLLTGILFWYGGGGEEEEENSLERDSVVRFLGAESGAVVTMVLLDAVIAAGMWVRCEKFDDIVVWWERRGRVQILIV